MAKNYKDNFDYSEAIANTQNAAERQQLLTERQNKINAEGLAGKVASNEAVSTWNGDYRPYSVSSGGGGGGRSNGGSGSSSSVSSAIAELYAAAESARLQRFEAARERIQQQLQSNLSSIESDYTAGMTQTDINARQSAISNEEKLAALGLNMGARSAAATSGAAESSRIALDNQYRSDLNALGQARLTARAAARDAAANQEAAIEGQYAQMQLAQLNSDRDYSISLAGLTGFLNGTPTMAWYNYQLSADTAANNAALQALQLSNSSQAQAYEQALNRWKTSGYVQAGDAAILGVPAGTPTADVSYQNANLALQQWKAGYWY